MKTMFMNTNKYRRRLTAVDITTLGDVSPIVALSSSLALLEKFSHKNLKYMKSTTKVQNPRRIPRIYQANNARLLATPLGVAILRIPLSVVVATRAS